MATAPAIQPVAPAFCRQCGGPLQPAVKFCPKCGTEVASHAVSPTRPSPDPLQSGIDDLERAVAEHPGDERYPKLLAVALHDDAMKDWWEDPEDKKFLCVSFQGIAHARNQLKRATELQFNDPELRKHIAESVSLVDSMEQRKFAGSWLMVVVLGLFYIIPGVIWWYVNRRPGYLINKDYMTHIQTGKHAGAAAKMGGLQGKVYDFFEKVGGEWGGLMGLVFMLTIGVVLSPVFMVLAYKQNYLDVQQAAA